MLAQRAVLDTLPAPLAELLSAHFVRTKQRLTPLLQSGKIAAVILAGGYGRAEGGVASTGEQTARLFNDLDYFVFCDNPGDSELLQAIRSWEVDESPALGIDVEAVCIRPQQVEASGASMMFYDLLHGHCVVLGPADFLQSRFPLPPHGRIAAIEATRLLWNRGSGLWFARVDLEQASSPIVDAVIHRNQAKALLGLGDAWLSLNGLYRPLVAERRALMASAETAPEHIRRWHAEGADFKRHPTPAPERSILQSRQEELAAAWSSLFLQVESQRLGVPLKDGHSYSLLRKRLFPQSPVLKNCLLALRDRLQRGGCLQPVWDYPRSALQRALPLLLAPDIDFRMVQSHLGSGARDVQSTQQLYRKWWHHYS